MKAQREIKRSDRVAADASQDGWEFGLQCRAEWTTIPRKWYLAQNRKINKAVKRSRNIAKHNIPKSLRLS